MKQLFYKSFREKGKEALYLCQKEIKTDKFPLMLFKVVENFSKTIKLTRNEIS